MAQYMYMSLPRSPKYEQANVDRLELISKPTRAYHARTKSPRAELARAYVPLSLPITPRPKTVQKRRKLALLLTQKALTRP